MARAKIVLPATAKCISGRIMFVDCAKSDSAKLYELLISAIVPRPIAWVSSRGKSGVDNLAPFSFFNLFSISPPILGFSPGLKRAPDGSKVMKDTLRNILETEDFVVNLVNDRLADKMVLSSANFDYEISEFNAIGLNPAVSTMVNAPRLAESPLNLDCRLYKTIELGTNQLVLGEILCVHVDQGLLSDGRIDPTKLKPLARLGGDQYCLVNDVFELARP